MKNITDILMKIILVRQQFLHYWFFQSISVFLFVCLFFLSSSIFFSFAWVFWSFCNRGQSPPWLDLFRGIFMFSGNFEFWLFLWFLPQYAVIGVWGGKIFLCVNFVPWYFTKIIYKFKEFSEGVFKFSYTENRIMSK